MYNHHQAFPQLALAPVYFLEAMREVQNIILPFPNGVVRSGSKVGSKYKALIASTNDAYCPTLSSVVEKTEIGEGVNCVLEIVIDGLGLEDVEQAMRVGAEAAIKPGVKKISAGEFFPSDLILSRRALPFPDIILIRTPVSFVNSSYRTSSES